MKVRLNRGSGQPWPFREREKKRERDRGPHCCSLHVLLHLAVENRCRLDQYIYQLALPYIFDIFGCLWEFLFFFLLCRSFDESEKITVLFFTAWPIHSFSNRVLQLRVICNINHYFKATTERHWWRYCYEPKAQRQSVLVGWNAVCCLANGQSDHVLPSSFMAKPKLCALTVWPPSCTVCDNSNLAGSLRFTPCEMRLVQCWSQCDEYLGDCSSST